MVNNNKFFYLSGLIAFSIFALFIIPFLFMLISSKNNDIYSLKKDKFISISLSITNKSINIKKEFEKKIVVPDNAESIAKEIDINNLFNDVWTKEITANKVTKKVSESKRLLKIKNKIKNTKKNNVQSIAEQVEEYNKNKNITTSTAKEVNEYLAKIQAIVYKNFYVPQNSEGNSVKTVIELNNLGKVTSFRILRYSNNEALNREVDKISERLKYIIFPKNPQNKSSRTIVILVSKELN